MIRTELFKLRTHRTPWVLFAILVASLAVAPIYYAIKNPDDPSDVIATFVVVFGAMTPLLGAVFGGWVVGHEFRQGTLRRVLGNDARRGRLLTTKAAVGLGAIIAGMAVAAGVGVLASVFSVASFGESIVWDDTFRNVISAGFYGLVTAAIAFGFSVLLRSDTYAMLGALGLIIIIGPLLTLIPKVGKYTPSAVANDVALWIAAPKEQLSVGIAQASLTAAAYIIALAAAATATFNRRDI